MTYPSRPNLIPVALLGATGSVGQKFADLLNGHPWFELVAAAASPGSVGKPFRHLTLQASTPDIPGDIVFSALDASCAEAIEGAFRSAGRTVISNARNYRMHDDVPLVVPEVNGDQIKNHTGIITNPNCSVIGLVMALKPLQQFGLKSVHVNTLQAISGAGKALPDIDDNVIPYIEGEEEKIETEPLKILGDPTLIISAHCHRVPVTDGHLLSVAVQLDQNVTRQQIIDAWESLKPLDLPSAPQKPLTYMYQSDRPQPRLDRNREKGMGVTLGRLRPCPHFGWKFSVLSHNTIRGAAGCAILNAELLISKFTKEIS